MSVGVAVHDTVTLDSDGDGKLNVDLNTSPQADVCGIPRSSSSHGPSPRVLNIASPAFSASPEDKQGLNARSCNGALWRGPANAAGSPLDSHCQAGQGVLRASASSLPTGKVRLHSVQKGAGIGKHMNGRAIGRASKLAQLDIAAEHIGASSHLVLQTSPRLLRSPGRKKSPIRWFPRKKTESYLDRKIRMLQEKEGKLASLDETLGAGNPHLSRIEREKLAAQTAAAEAMNSKKGALVEASWCRILKLAGIPCKSAILELQKAEEKAASALAEAENHGVILHHGPAERESSSEAITASLDSAFDVDKEVTAAIKVALRQVSRCSERECDTALKSSGDMAIEGFSEAESQSDPESKVEDALVSVMLSRIRDLSLEDQTALAGIVATRGLSALLKNQSLEQELNEKAAELFDCKPPHNEGSDLGSILVKHVSRLQREVQAAKDTSRHIQAEGDNRSGGPGRLLKVSHVESLDQILVKHVSKLEKAKLAAQASRKMPPKTPGLADLPTGSREQNESCHNSLGRDRKKLVEVTNTPYSSGTLGSNLVKIISALEKEKQAASIMQEPTMSTDMQAANLQSECAKTHDVPGATLEQDPDTAISSGRISGSDILANEPIPYISQSKSNPRSNSSDIPGLGSILVKHVSRLEKEKQMAVALQDAGRQAEKPKQSSCEVGSGDILVKRLSRLEIEKAKALESDKKESHTNENSCPATLHAGSENDETGGRAVNTADALITKAQKSRQLEGTWGGPSMLRGPPSIRSNAPRRKSLREKQLEDTWGGVSLGNTLKRHVSKLEKEQAAWRRAEEEARQRPTLQR